MAILEIKNVTKIYTTHINVQLTAVDDVSFNVDAGEVVGFIGPNGAGKSTTIKMITGLCSPTKGNIYIEGHDIAKERISAMENVGAIVETPDLYLEWTALENLKYLANISNIEIPEDKMEFTKKEIIDIRIDDIFKLIGLFDRRLDKVRKYSLGMKQRLGIAQALLSRPKLLILDEPNNGLDPSGIKEMRNIIIHLAHELNMAVLVSSHQLAEMQLMCDRFVIIKNGKIIAACDKSQLNTNKEGTTIIIACDNIVGAKDILKEKFNIDVKLNSGTIEFTTTIDTGEIAKELILAGISVKGISQKEVSLEDVFMNLTEKEGK